MHSRLKLLAALALFCVSSVAQGPPALLVDPNSPGAYQTIQSAIDAAPSGAVINIKPGAYGELLKITKPLELRGESGGQVHLGVPPINGITNGSRLLALLEKKRGADWRRTAQGPEQENALKELGLPLIEVTGARHVTISGLKLTHPANGDRNSLFDVALINFSQSSAKLLGCEIVGGPANGVMIGAGSSVVVSNCLVAAHWGTGIAVGGRGALDVKAQIIDSEVRNCYHRCITISSREEVRVERCRVSGSSWHGIRYDHCSPVIASSVIADNYRSGIYASGNTFATVTNNLFLNNGLSAWFLNRDSIERNTFHAPDKGGVIFIGMSTPSVVANVFYDTHTALSQSTSQGIDAETLPKASALTIQNNIFAGNAIVWRGVKDHKGFAKLSESPLDQAGNTMVELSPAKPNLESDLAEVHDKFPDRGSTLKLNELRSWPIQPRETAILPPDGSRTTQLWRN